MKIDINFYQFKDHLRVRKTGKKVELFDPVRNKHITWTKEEVLRQTVLTYLLREKSYPAKRIVLEKWLKVNGNLKRFDIFVYSQELAAFLLVECKSPEVEISDATFRQIAMYNLPLQAQFLLVTNGLDTYCCQMDYPNQSFQYLPEVPQFPPIANQ